MADRGPSSAVTIRLAEAAAAITAIGHGLKLDEPVNRGSLAWADSAFRVLEELAAISRYERRHWWSLRKTVPVFDRLPDTPSPSRGWRVSERLIREIESRG